MKKDIYYKRLPDIAGKVIAVYPSAAPDMPVIYLNTFAEEGDKDYLKLLTDEIVPKAEEQILRLYFSLGDKECRT